MADPDLAQLAESWSVTLRAERKSPQTIRSYLTGVERYLSWCSEFAMPAVLNRRQVTSWVESLLANGAQAATARSRQVSLRRFSAWLVDEGELDSDPLLGIKPPKMDAKVIRPLTEVDLRALLKACSGKAFADLRDTALLRLMIESGMRAGEAAALSVRDVNVVGGTAVIARAKGGKGRVVPFGPKTAQALDRYLRARRSHRLAATPPLWLGSKSTGFSYAALHRALAIRAKAAGVEGFHPHRLRHTAAHRWLVAGGSEGGLMAVAGWSSREMLDRYSRHHAADRAAEEARGLNLGEL